jgi:hypothetical protein
MRARSCAKVSGLGFSALEFDPLLELTAKFRQFTWVIGAAESIEHGTVE